MAEKAARLPGERYASDTIPAAALLGGDGDRGEVAAISRGMASGLIRRRPENAGFRFERVRKEVAAKSGEPVGQRLPEARGEEMASACRTSSASVHDWASAAASSTRTTSDALKTSGVLGYFRCAAGVAAPWRPIS